MTKQIVTDIESLIRTFNLARCNNSNVEGIARQIALLATEQVDSYFSYYTANLNEHLKGELVEYISNTLAEANEIRPIFLKDLNIICGIMDENNSIIYKNDVIGLTPGGAFNDFFKPNSESRGDRVYGLGGMITQKGLACGDRFYILDSEQDFLANVVLEEGIRNNYKKIFLKERNYICRKYDEKGLASISYVYPNNSKEHFYHELGEFVGETVRHTNDKKEYSTYKRGIISEKSGEGMMSIPECHGDIEMLVMSEPNSTIAWKELEESTRIYTPYTPQNKNTLFRLKESVRKLFR